MRSLAYSAAIAFASVAAVQPLQAQADERLQRTAYRVAFKVVSCASKESPTSLNKLLETELGSKEEAKQSSRMQALARRCAGEAPKLTPLLVRNVTAIMLYNDEFRLAAPGSSAALPLPKTFAVVPAERSGTEAQQIIWQVAGIANCLAWAEPELARKMVLAKPDQKSEEDAFAALKPGFDKCIPGRPPLRIRPIEFRGVLAEQLLRRSRLLRSAKS